MTHKSAPRDSTAKSGHEFDAKFAYYFPCFSVYNPLVLAVLELPGCAGMQCSVPWLSKALRPLEWHCRVDHWPSPMGVSGRRQVWMSLTWGMNKLKTNWPQKLQQAKAINGNGNKPFLKCLLIHAHFGATLQSGKIHRNKTPIPASPPTAASCQQLPLVSSWLLSPPWKTVLLSQAKKRRKLHGKRLQRNLVLSEKSSHNLKLWMDCPKHLECLSTAYLHAIISNTFGPDSIPFLLLPVVLPCASLAVRGPSKMHQILIWLPLPPATLAESS